MSPRGKSDQTIVEMGSELSCTAKSKLKHTTSLFSLSDHYILSREWRVFVDLAQTNYHGRHMVYGCEHQTTCNISKLGKRMELPSGSVTQGKIRPDDSGDEFRIELHSEIQVKTHHFIIFFVRPLHSEPGMESFC